ncbi:hypothetical protein E2C01_063669 [Portunus trituberculatus]|uniref:Uncharacterized protein n=1 Tax=Portunus trituberculatus TaxID=210409 RepID=A0A5B7HLI6_PORTR|nr:hypothetical protein [Portunus trituberculatus]
MCVGRCIYHLKYLPLKEETLHSLLAPVKEKRGPRGAVEPCVLWDPRGLQAHGFKSCPRSECRLGFLTRDKGFLAGGV